MQRAQLIWPEAGKLDDLGPLIGVVRNEVTELGRRARKRGATQVCQPRLELGIGKHRVDLRVELLDDSAGGALRHSSRSPVRNRSLSPPREAIGVVSRMKLKLSRS